MNFNPLDAVKDIANEIGNAVEDVADFAGDLVGDTAGFIGDVAEGAIDFAGDVFNNGAGIVSGMFGGAGTLIKGAGQFVGLPSPADFVKDPVGSIVDVLPPIFTLPGFPFPKAPQLDGDLPSLEGLDPMTALMVIQSYIEQKSGDTVQLLGTLTQVQASLQEAQALDLAKGVNPDDSKSATSQAKSEVMKKFGDELSALGVDSKSDLDLGQVSTAINMLTMQVQKMESFRQQLNTMSSNLLKSDHEAKMVTLRNIPTR